MADFYTTAASQRMAQIEAERAPHLADLAAYKSNKDPDSATQTIQALANLEAEKTNLVALHNQYLQSQQAPPEPSPEERAARPLNRMDWHDVVEMTRASKYAKDIRPDDPAMIAGYYEAQRRRARGE